MGAPILNLLWQASSTVELENPKLYFRDSLAYKRPAAVLHSAIWAHGHEISKEEARNGHQQAHGRDRAIRKEIVRVSCGHGDEGPRHLI